MCKCEQYFVLCNLISIYDGYVVAIVLSGIDPRHAIREESKKFLAKNKIKLIRLNIILAENEGGKCYKNGKNEN